jgi:hypothetical protein
MSTSTGIALPSAQHPIALSARSRWPLLRIAVVCWFGVAVIGQLIFAAYVVAVYGGAVAAGQMGLMNRVTPRGWIPGETLGNLVFGSHVLFTVVVVLGGLIQLLPPLRRRAPVLHRWNGRLVLLLAVVLSVGGLVMLLTRGTVGGFWQQAGTGLNGLVIAVCAAMAWRHARGRRFDLHRRWALRLFLSISGVWFFRVGLMAWLMIFRAPVGFDPKTFSGPFLTALAFAQFLLPLAVLELVLLAQTRPWVVLQRATALLLIVLTGLMALGIAGATMGLWLPRM